MLGLGGGASGTGFSGPTQALQVQPTTAAQANTAYGDTQNSMAQQQALLAALQQQQGLQNQSQVYGQLQGVVNGTGPNPAQAALNQNTGQNVANQAALMAGQRGASQNVGMIARQAGQQGAAIQQGAVGQAATLQANQSLNALSQAGQLATTQAGQQIGQTNANTQAQQAEQSNILNAIQGQNTTNVQQQNGVNTANAALANTQMQGQQGLIGGVMNGAGALMGGGAEGGDVRMADGGAAASPYSLGVNTNLSSGPQSSFGQFVSGVNAPDEDDNSTPQQAPTTGAGALQQGMSTFAQGIGNQAGLAKGGNVGHKLKKGGHVPGTPKVKGAVNDYANDTVDAKLSPGEIVLPRSVTKSADPIKASAAFVANVLAKRKVGK